MLITPAPASGGLWFMRKPQCGCRSRKQNLAFLEILEILEILAFLEFLELLEILAFLELLELLEFLELLELLAPLRQAARDWHLPPPAPTNHNALKTSIFSIQQHPSIENHGNF